MAASARTVAEVVEQLVRWQRKHGLRDDQMDELLRWIQKPVGSRSFSQTVRALAMAYKARGE